MTIVIGQNYFIDLNSEWFNEQYENKNNSYEYPDEPYTQFVDEMTENLGVTGDFTNVRVKVQYLSGNEFIIDGVKGLSEDILFYDLDNNVWKHRHAVMVRPLTERGVKILEDTIESIQSTPAFMELDEEVKLIGEIQENVEDCITCRKGK